MLTPVDQVEAPAKTAKAARYDKTRRFSTDICSCFGSIVARSHLGSAIEKSTHTPAYDKLRELLVEAREAAGMSQRDLAERLGVHHSWVAKVEIGERRLDLVEFIVLTRALGVEAPKVLKAVSAKLR